MLNRGTETEEQVLKRLRNAKAEIEQGQSSGIFDHMLYNDNLEDCYKSLKVVVNLSFHCLVASGDFIYSILLVIHSGW